MVVYRRVPTSKTEPSVMKRPQGAVLDFPWVDAVEFACPCGKREVYVTSPPHGISFDAEGRLTLKGSCGYREIKNPSTGEILRPENWCHFKMEGGAASMYDDAVCPGNGGCGDAEIP